MANLNLYIEELVIEGNRTPTPEALAAALAPHLPAALAAQPRLLAVVATDVHKSLTERLSGPSPFKNAKTAEGRAAQ
jgi:hypothetical protein